MKYNILFLLLFVLSKPSFALQCNINSGLCYENGPQFNPVHIDYKHKQNTRTNSAPKFNNTLAPAMGDLGRKAYSEPYDYEE